MLLINLNRLSRLDRPSRQKFESPTAKTATKIMTPRLAVFLLSVSLCLGGFTGCGGDKKTTADDARTDDLTGSLNSKQGTKRASESDTKSASEKTTEKQKSFLKIQIVKGNEEGSVDFIVTNTSNEVITNCMVQYFDGDPFKIAKRMEPGQVSMCGVVGAIPETITFQSDQFDEFEFTLPDEPESEIDMSEFKWADPDDGVESSEPPPNFNKDDEKARSESSESKAPRKRERKKSSDRDLMDFGDDDLEEEVAPGKKNETPAKEDDQKKQGKKKDDTSK